MKVNIIYLLGIAIFGLYSCDSTTEKKIKEIPDATEIKEKIEGKDSAEIREIVSEEVDEYLEATGTDTIKLVEQFEENKEAIEEYIEEEITENNAEEAIEIIESVVEEKVKEDTPVAEKQYDDGSADLNNKTLYYSKYRGYHVHMSEFLKKPEFKPTEFSLRDNSANVDPNFYWWWTFQY